MSLLYIGQQISIYGGIFLVIAGIIGNGINVLVFSTVRTYRTTPSTVYLLITSIYNLIYILLVQISRIVTSGYGIDLSRTSVSWCKLRQFFGILSVLTSLTCSCLATIDQYFITSRSVYLRRCSNIKWTYRIIFIVFIIWCLHGIPCLFFYDISSVTNSCINTNYVYSIYFSLQLIVLFCVIPSLVMLTFGYLTYRNIQLTRVLAEQQADRQLMRMTSVQIALVLIAFIPIAIYNTYSLITSSISKDTSRLMIESFIATVSYVMFSIYFAGSCYLFLVSSSRFRRATIDRIFICWQPNQVVPSQIRTAGTGNLVNRPRN